MAVPRPSTIGAFVAGAVLMMIAQFIIFHPGDVPAPVMVHITKTGNTYHSAGCRLLGKSDIEITFQEAQARKLTPCKTCKP